MYCYGFAFAPLNLLFLGLGILLLVLAQEMQLELPAAGDDILPLFATQGYLAKEYLSYLQSVSLPPLSAIRIQP